MPHLTTGGIPARGVWSVQMEAHRALRIAFRNAGACGPPPVQP
jgi:hypothetical protein